MSNFIYGYILIFLLLYWLFIWLNRASCKCNIDIKKKVFYLLDGIKSSFVKCNEHIFIDDDNILLPAFRTSI